MIQDIKEIGKYIHEIRKKRWESYKENRDKENDEYEKYWYCETLETFADELNVDRRTLGKWERGESLPSLDKLVLICELLDCNIDYFLGADELPYINSISKASHFTGINPEIIECAIKDEEYLDCLNFFMNPDNFKELYQEVTLSAWKKFFIEQNLSDIKSPLIDRIEKAFQDFFSFTPFSEISSDKYKEYLIKYLPAKELDFYSAKNRRSVINIKKSLQFLTYKKFEQTIKKEKEYECFIDFIAELTYYPLSSREFMEIQKQKIAMKFIELVTRYLKDV